MSATRRTPIAAVALLAAALLTLLGAQVGAAAGGPATAARACPGQENANAPATAQERAMLCLVNQARKQRGLEPLAAPAVLAGSAARKSGDILSCDEFSHEACGREFTHWIKRSGYRGCRMGENIGYGGGSLGSPLAVFRMWMRSTGHRRNILGPFEEIGIGLRVGELEGFGDAHVWTQHFGSSCR